MEEIYKISSTERVQQVEKELAMQLAELKTEIEGNGILQGTPHCSVPLPKDVDYFRREREWTLKKCLQVAEAKPLVIQTDVLKRELDSCLKREYTAESLPFLLYQFFIDRIPQLVQSKYLHMLRWKRFCQHSSVIEQLYPFYQKQVAQIMQEYNDAIQRAARLSSVRESFLTGKEIPINLVTQEDLMIYTQWLICHLHSLKTVHAYLQVLQHLPISHRREVAIDRHPFQGDGDKASGKMDFLSYRMQVSIHPSTLAIEGTIARSALPQHTADIDQLKPQLRLLLSQLDINYDVENLRHSANEMELFSMIKPQQDPWQQKLLIKLKQWKKVDEQLQIQSKLLQVHSVQFMEFAEVENHDDFYTVEEAYIHTQDQRGAFVMYDVALQDLKETEKQLLLVASQYIKVEKGQKAGPDSSSNSYSRRAQTSLLDSYFEVYQHALDSEERFALAQVITNIMYRRPRFDFHLGYFVNTYRDECTCLKLHLCLVRDIMNRQIENQRKYNHKIWRGGPKGCISEFGFPPHIVTKQLIALSNSPTALKNMYLLEFHSSLGLVSLIPKSLDHILQEFQQICRPNTASEAINLEEQILQLSLDGWMTMENPESFYGAQIQRDIFADVLVEDPLIIREIVTLALKSVSEEEQRPSKEKQTITLNVFSRFLEVLTLRHRLIEAAIEGAQLGRLYKEVAEEMGFNEFHLYLRPVYFECATHKEKADQFSPIFITSLLEDHDLNMDRYIPSNLMLEIQDIDNQIGKFSFCTRESILQLEKQGPRDLMLNTFIQKKQILESRVQNPVGCSALRHTLQIVASFHDIIAYIFSFAQLGSAPGCLDYRCPSEHLTADWGGTEQIGNELLEIQKKIDSLPNPSDPKKVSHMLTMLKEVKFLQFEAAVRYSMREAFLSSGNVSAYQSITDNIYHALPPMSNAVFGSAFASQLQIPQLLDPHGQRLCLCGLSTEDQKVAHGELIGIQFVMEDVLWNSEILTDHQEVQKPFRKVSATSTAEAKGKALTAPPDTMTSYALQRSYLIQWKQLEILKAEWGRLKLKVEDINTFQKLLENVEIHMIHDVQKKINKEITLVLSEKAREGRHLPTACDVMARERSNFETYSMFYENLLHRQHQLLYKKEQEVHVVEDNTGALEVDLSQIARLSHEMILEITALRAKVTDLRREDHNIKEKIRKEVQEDYEALVQNTFLVCLQIKGKVDEYRLSMNKQMLEIISEVRKEGVEKIINLKKKFGSTKDNSALEEHLAQGKLQELRDENSELEKLLCKLKVLKLWKETMQKAQFLTTLQEIEKEAIQNKKECLQSQMKAEEEAILFNHQLRAVRKVLAESQSENKKLKQQLEKQEYLLQEAERKINREFCKRQQLDLIKTANLDKMLENLGEREVKLLNLTEESEKSSRTRNLQEAKMKKEIQQIKSQLIQERNLKLNAFQRIHELQCQRNDSEAAISQNHSPADVIPNKNEISSKSLRPWKGRK
ncbi:hypothetical protein L345_04247, partial [Ophiophagus hannah]